MKIILKHIEQARGKPHHIRRQIAFGTAAACTSVVALVWFVGTVRSGTLALNANSSSQNVGNGGIVVDASGNENQLAGAAAAIPISQTQAHIEIIDSAPSTSSGKKVEQTTIPF